jgi:hypothetical protein
MLLENIPSSVHQAYSLTAIYERIIVTTWNPSHLTNLKTSTACYRDSFHFLYANDIGISRKTHL